MSAVDDGLAGSEAEARGDGASATVDLSKPVPERPVEHPAVEPVDTDAGADTEESSAPEAGEAPPRTRHRRSGRSDRGGKGSFLRELPVLIVIALGLALLIKAFLLQAFFIPSGSMEQTLHIGDRVLVNKLVYDFRDPHRGEVVVFDSEGLPQWGVEGSFAEPSNPVAKALRTVQGWFGFGQPDQHAIIKRVIGVPGDSVSCNDTTGVISVNGVALDEPYVFSDSHSDHRTVPCNFTAVANPVTVPAGQLFVMGDHRDNSADSRLRGFVPINHVVGRAFVRVWPLSRLGTLPVPDTFSHTHGAVGDPGLALGAALVTPVAALRLRRHRRRAVLPGVRGRRTVRG